MTQKGLECQIKSTTYNTLCTICFGCIFFFNFTLKQNNIIEVVYGIQQKRDNCNMWCESKQWKHDKKYMLRVDSQNVESM